MEKIASFTVDHDVLGLGMYISRIDGDVVTYDIRMKLPNKGDYLDVPGMHTIEHLFATYARNTAWKDNIIYVGPMGCRTGFYLLTRNMPHEAAIQITYDAMRFIQGFEGEIPGTASSKECGNYKEHDLAAAKRDVAAIADVLEGYPVERLSYDYKG
ncbi:MAG: S-ribosylhomocysteine lyase [Oscillospiraceae bacterium]|jgi:S-ribosylhomocysteine lyase